MWSKVSMYRTLKLLPPSMRTLESRFVPTIGSTMMGYVAGCGTLLGWSRQSKVIDISDH
jgi:hypothetical protein